MGGWRRWGSAHSPFIRAIIWSAMILAQLQADPPFLTDDPEPVGYHHWEFYLASQHAFGRVISTGTLPHLEVNVGAFPNTQLHVIIPLGYSRSAAGHTYGVGDVELGIKYRFVQESDDGPQIGTFPLVELPTGSAGRGLGNGSAQVLLPIWMQKSWGKFTTYGGAGWWIIPAAGHQHWAYAGWEAQYEISDMVTIGGELYSHTADVPGTPHVSGLNAGGYFNLDEHHHILLSLGRTFAGGSSVTAYVGYQLTI